MTRILLLVGGPNKGTRFRPLSLDVPKPLYPIAGKSIIEHVLEPARQIPDLKDVVLMGYYKKELFDEFLPKMTKEFGVPFSYIQEESGEMGTAGGMYKYRKQLLEGSDELIVVHSDVCCNFPMLDILKFHRALGKECTILGIRVPRDEARHYGCLIEDPNTHELLHYAEKPESFVSDLINAGLYVFSRNFFNEIEKAHELVAIREPHYTGETNETLRLEQDVLFPLAGKGSCFVYRAPNIRFWRQIKHASAAVYCNDLYTTQWRDTHPELLAKGANIVGNVVIHPSAIVDPTARIGPNVYIGEGTRIGAGARLAHSIVSSNCIVKDHACILFSILASDCIVGMWTRLEGLHNPSPTPSVGPDRQGVTILGTGVTANSEIVVYNCIVMPNKSITEDTRDEIVL